MQVSWIDADRLKALVAQIAPQEAGANVSPQSEEIASATDLAFSSVAETSWGTATGWMEPETEAPPVVESIAPVTERVLPQEMMAEPETDEDLAEKNEYASPLHNPAAALPLSRIRDKLRAIRQRATEAGILTRASDGVRTAQEITERAPHPAVPMAEMLAEIEAAHAPAATAAVENKVETTPAVVLPSPHLAFAIPPGSRDERLAAFAGWARLVLHEDGGHVLVMSDDGEVLWGGEAKAGLVLSTMMAWGAAIRASAMAACETPAVIRRPLASGNVLTVIPCETSSGMIHVAVAAPAALSDATATVLRGGLVAVFQHGA